MAVCGTIVMMMVLVLCSSLTGCKGQGDGDIVIGLSDTEIFVDEDDRFFAVCALVISGEFNLVGSIPFSLTSSDGTAIGIVDYGVLSATDLEFTTSILEVCVNVTIINDDIYEVDETFLVTISTDDSQVVVQPEQEVVNVTIIDKDGITIGFENDRYSIQEFQLFVIVCARIISGNLKLERNAIVSFSTLDGSESVDSLTTFNAIAPQDYQQTTKDLVFNRSNRRLCVNIPIVNNDSQLSVVQGIKVFRAILQTNAPRVTLEPNVAEIQILNDFSLRFENSQYTFIEGRDRRVELCVVVFRGSAEGEVFLLKLLDETTTAGLDYLDDMFLDLTIENERGCVSLQIIDDNVFEGGAPELLRVELTDDVMQSVLAVAEVLIVDNDGELTVQFSQSNYTVNETDSKVMICLEAQTQPGVFLPIENTPVLVTLLTDKSQQAQSPATAGMDYTSVRLDSLNLTPFFAEATTTATVCVLNISIIDDNIFEGTESFDVYLDSQSQGVTIVQNRSEVVIFDDDIRSSSAPSASITSSIYIIIPLLILKLTSIELSVSII